MGGSTPQPPVNSNPAGLQHAPIDYAIDRQEIQLEDAWSWRQIIRSDDASRMNETEATKARLEAGRSSGFNSINPRDM